MTETRLITHRIVDDLKMSSESSTSMYWMTAFAMTSGVKIVLSQLKAASARGCEIKILVGDYLYITQPDALELLLGWHFQMYKYNHTLKGNNIVQSTSRKENRLDTAVIESFFGILNLNILKILK